MIEKFEKIHSSGDFIELLKRSGNYPKQVLSGISNNKALEIPQGTTVLAFHYRDGIIVAGDRGLQQEILLCMIVAIKLSL